MKRLLQFFVIWLFILILNALSHGQTTDKKNIAIIDLENRGSMLQEEAKMLTDRLRSALVQTNAFIVVDRRRTEEVLKEQGLQQTGCTSFQCAIEVGRMLHVEQIVTGSIGIFDRIFTIEIMLVDVETSQIKKSISQDFDGEKKELLHFMNTIANLIVGIDEPPSPKELDVGILQIITEPVLAEVLLDDTPVGETPLKLENISSGQHKIKVIAEGYAPIEGKIKVEKGKVNKFKVTLKKTWSLNIISDPSNAEVYINGEYAGTTPYYKTVNDGIRLNLRVKKKKYKDWIDYVTVIDDIEIQAKLKGKGKTWLWLGTLALAGGGAYYYMFNEDKGQSIEKTGFPSPPGRP
jgi:TolB-like protein